MVISPDLLSAESRELAETLHDYHDSPLAALFADSARGEEINSSVRISKYHILAIGQTTVRLEEITNTPEENNTDEMSEAVALIFNRHKGLVAIQDQPREFWGWNTLINSILPARRRTRKAQLISKAESLIHTAANPDTSQ